MFAQVLDGRWTEIQMPVKSRAYEACMVLQFLFCKHCRVCYLYSQQKLFRQGQEGNESSKILTDYFCNIFVAKIVSQYLIQSPAKLCAPISPNTHTHIEICDPNVAHINSSL